MVWILLGFALVLSFLLSGLESAVLSVSRVRLRLSGIALAAVYSPQGRPLGIVSTGDLVRRMLNQP